MMSGFNNSTSSNINTKANASIESRKRNRFTNEQIQALEALFLDCPRPCKETQLQASKDLGLALRTVIIWFQNRRAKAKHSGEHIPENVLQWKPPMVATKAVDARKLNSTQAVQSQVSLDQTPRVFNPAINFDSNIGADILEAEKWIESLSNASHIEEQPNAYRETHHQMQFNALGYNPNMPNQAMYSQSNNLGQTLNQPMLNDSFNFDTQSINSMNSNVSNYNPMMYQSSVNQSNLSLSTMASSHWSNESYVQNHSDIGQFYQMHNGQGLSSGMLPNQVSNMSLNLNQQHNPSYQAQPNNSPGKMHNIQKTFTRSLNRSNFFNFRS